MCHVLMGWVLFYAHQLLVCMGYYASDGGWGFGKLCFDEREAGGGGSEDVIQRGYWPLVKR